MAEDKRADALKGLLGGVTPPNTSDASEASRKRHGSVTKTESHDATEASPKRRGGVTEASRDRGQSGTKAVPEKTTAKRQGWRYSKGGMLRVQAYLDDETADALAAYMDAESRPASWVIRQALRKHLGLEK